MKLRIRNNSIRLRLQRAELEALVRGGVLQDALVLGPEPADRLHYGIALSEAPDIGVLHEPGTIKVLLPRAFADALAETERVGFEGEFPVAEDTVLRILIEKDFRCLVERPGEDESGAFPNPEEGGTC
jgi:hypothetical protein